MTATLYPVFFVRVRRQGENIDRRIVEDASVPAEGQQVIRAKIKQLVYEDNDDKADALRLTVDAFDLAYYNDPWIKGGDLLKVKFGYPGVLSPLIEGVVSKIKGSGSMLTIESNGKEYLFNRTVKPRTFTNMRRSDVVREIVTAYGYGSNAEIVDTEIVFPVIRQSKLTDHQMIVEMAKREGWVFYIDANGLYFGPRKLDGPVIRTIDRSDMYHPGFNVESDLFARPGTVTAKGRDPDKKKNFTATANNDTTKGAPVLSHTREVVDEQTGATSFQKTAATATTVATTARTEADAKRQVAGIYQNGQLGAVKGSFSKEGEWLPAKSIVQLTGIGAILVGKYYLTQVTHTVGDSSYSIKVQCRRESMNSVPGATKATSKGAPNKNAAPAAGATDDKLKPREVVDDRTGQTRVEYRK